MVAAGGNPNPNHNQYIFFQYSGASTWNATEAARTQIVPISCTMSNFLVRLPSAPGAGKSISFHWRTNGATAVTLTVADAATTANDASTAVTLSPGIRVNYFCTTNGAPTMSAPAFSTHINAAQYTSMVMAGSSAAVGSGETNYFGLQLDGLTTLIESEGYVLIPTGLTIKSLFFGLETGTAGGTGHTCELLTNGVVTALSASCNNGNTINSNMVNSIHCDAGTLACWRVRPTNGAAAKRMKISAEIYSDIDGESILTYCGNGNTQSFNNSTRYHYVLGGSSGNFTGTDTRFVLTQAGTLKKFYLQLSAAPGGSATWTYRARKNAANATPSIAITDGSTTGNDVVNSTSFASGDTLSMQAVPASTPALSQSTWGMVWYVAPPATGVATNNDFFPFFNL